jgi:tetratricopeptide (TPR) repeat protein
MITAAFAGLLLLLQAGPQPTQEYIEINSTLMLSCSRGAMDAERGQVRAEALADCTRSLETEPLSRFGEAQTLINRGVIRLRAGQTTAALADFDAAVRKQPDLASAYLNRAGAHLGASRFDQALADAERAVRLDPNNARAIFMRGAAHELKGEAKLAYRDYQAAAKLAPDWDAPKAELTRFKVVKK